MGLRVRIKDIEGCAVVFGRPLHRLEKPGKSDPAPEPQPYRCLMPIAIQDGYMDESSFGERKFYSKPPEESFTQEGDVVIKLSAPFTTAPVPADYADIFIPSSCAVLRFTPEARERFLPSYVSGFLNLGPIADSIRGQAAGSKALIINSNIIGEFDIPLLPYDQQEKLAALVQARIDKVRARREMEQLEERIVQAAFADALSAFKEAN